MARADDDGWTAGHPAVCVSLCSAATPERLRDELAGAAALEFSSVEESEGWVLDSDRYDRAWSAFGRYHGVAVAWEDNGFAGTELPRVLRLSRDGEFASMYWNVNAVMQFTLASAGRVVRRFDPLFHGDAEDEIGEPLPGEAALDWSEAPIRGGVRLLSRHFDLPSISPKILKKPGMRFFAYQR